MSDNAADAHINRLLLSESPSNVMLGLQLALNPAVQLSDITGLLGLALLEPHQKVRDMAIDALGRHFGHQPMELVKAHWQETHRRGTPKVLYQNLERIEQELGLQPGVMQALCVRMTHEFPDGVAHLFPHAFLEWCRIHVSPAGELDFGQEDMPRLPKCVVQLAQVTSIRFGNCGLRSLPGFVGKLRSLKTLNLYGTHVQALPGALADLTMLEHLILDGDSIKVMPEVLAKIPALRHLQVFDGRPGLLETLPPVPQVEVLELHQGHHNTLPASDGRLAGLRSLKLHGATIPVFPSSLLECPMLEEVSVLNAYIVWMPADLRALRQLRHLALGKMASSVAPPILEGLSRLEHLEWHANNRKPGLFPAHWCQLGQLKTLVWHGGLEGLPDEFQGFQNLESATFKDSLFKEFPKVLSMLPQLRRLTITGARFPEGAEIDVSSLIQLEELTLNHCGLRVLPVGFGHLKHLRQLDLRNNHLSWVGVNALRLALPQVKIEI